MTTGWQVNLSTWHGTWLSITHTTSSWRETLSSALTASLLLYGCIINEIREYQSWNVDNYKCKQLIVEVLHSQTMLKRVWDPSEHKVTMVNEDPSHITLSRCSMLSTSCFMTERFLLLILPTQDKTNRRRWCSSTSILSAVWRERQDWQTLYIFQNLSELNHDMTWHRYVMTSPSFVQTKYLSTPQSNFCSSNPLQLCWMLCSQDDLEIELVKEICH